MSVLLSYFFLSCLVMLSVDSSAIVIKSGVLKNNGEAEDENVHDVKFHKGTANYEAENGFNNNGEKKFVLAEDRGRYGDQSSKKKAHLDANDQNQQNFHQNVGENLGNIDSKVAHHKGHHKSGFKNSYHKDESGSNSSYFDDGNDEGDEIVRKNYRGSYGDIGQRRQNQGNFDNYDYGNDQSRQGVYDNAGRYENDQSNQRNFNRNNYYDNREDLNRRNLGNSYQGGARYAEEKYLERPHYYHHPAPYYHDEPPYRRSLPPPLPPVKSHITVYEDPRYVNSDLRYRRSDDYVDDYIDLDIRNPPEREPYLRYYKDSRPMYYYD